MDGYAKDLRNNRYRVSFRIGRVGPLDALLGACYHSDMDNGMVDKERVLDAQIENGSIEQTITGEIVAQPAQDRNPWDRRPDESPYWYDAFLLYRNLPSHNRSILSAYKEHKRLTGFVNWQQIVNPSSDWYSQSKALDWDKRVALYYDHVIKESERQAEQAVREWYTKSRMDLVHVWDDLVNEYDMDRDIVMSKSQVVNAMKTVNQMTMPQSPSQSIDVQIILDNLPPDVQTALLERLATR